MIDAGLVAGAFAAVTAAAKVVDSWSNLAARPTRSSDLERMRSLLANGEPTSGAEAYRHLEWAEGIQVVDRLTRPNRRSIRAYAMFLIASIFIWICSRGLLSNDLAYQLNGERLPATSPHINRIQLVRKQYDLYNALDENAYTWWKRFGWARSLNQKVDWSAVSGHATAHSAKRNRLRASLPTAPSTTISPLARESGE